MGGGGGGGGGQGEASPPDIPSISTQASINYCLGFCCFQFPKTKSISSSDRVGGPSIHSLRVWSRVSSSNVLQS